MRIDHKACTSRLRSEFSVMVTLSADKSGTRAVLGCSSFIELSAFGLDSNIFFKREAAE